MPGGETLTTVDAVHEEGSYLFTARDPRGDATEVVLVPCEDGVEAWVNRCTHEAQRLATDRGAAIRDGEIICPKHGSMFDTCSGDCDNGEAAGTTLVDVDVAVEGDDVVLADAHYTFAHEGAAEDDDDSDGPSSSSHLQL